MRYGLILGRFRLAALPKFSDTLTLSQPGGTDYADPLALLAEKKIPDYAPDVDPISPNSDHLPPLRGKLWTFLYYSPVHKCWPKT